MQTLESLINLKLKYTIEEVMAEILEDKDIQLFIEKNKDFIDDETIYASRGALNRFVRSKNDEHYEPMLFLFNGFIEMKLVPRTTPIMLKYRDKVPSRLIYDDSTRKYKGVDIANYDVVTPDNSEAFGKVAYFIKNYEYGKKMNGLWLTGAYGIGKTYLLAGMATKLHEQKVGVNFVSASQLMSDLYEVYRSNSLGDGVQKKIEHLQKSEVLMIDDLGTEKITRNNIIDVLYAILKYRGENNKPTFITSNLTKDQYYSLILSKQGSDITKFDVGRLKEQLDVLTQEVQMTGKNRRSKAQ